MTLLTHAETTAPADWIVAALRTFGASVTSIVPEGFAAYARIFYPASDGGRLISWREVAAANGTQVHAAMQFAALTRAAGWYPNEQPAVYGRPPLTGELPEELVATVVSCLRPWTSTPETCWFASWEGWGRLRPYVALAPAFKVPQRRYHLLTGPIEAAAESLSEPPFTNTASLWWPDDRAWCVATEVDLDSTHVGCSRACLDALLAEPALEACEIDPGAGIAHDSDRLNRP